MGIFPVHQRMALIFTDFPTGSGSQSCALLEACGYQSNAQVNWKNSNVAQPSLGYNLVMGYTICGLSQNNNESLNILNSKLIDN